MEIRIRSFKEAVAPSEDLVGKQVKVVSGLFQGLEGKVVGINPADNGVRIENKDGDISTISPENVELVGE